MALSLLVQNLSNLRFFFFKSRSNLKIQGQGHEARTIRTARKVFPQGIDMCNMNALKLCFKNYGQGYYTKLFQK